MNQTVHSWSISRDFSSFLWEISVTSVFWWQFSYLEQMSNKESISVFVTQLQYTLAQFCTQLPRQPAECTQLSFSQLSQDVNIFISTAGCTALRNWKETFFLFKSPNCAEKSTLNPISNHIFLNEDIFADLKDQSLMHFGNLFPIKLNDAVIST